MAEIIGISGAWGEIAGDLLRHGMKVGEPREIAPLLSHLNETFKTSTEKLKAEAAGRNKLLEDKIVWLRNEEGFWAAIWNWLEILKCRIAIYRITVEKDRQIEALMANISRLEGLQNSPELAGAQAELSVIAQLYKLPAEYVVFNDIRLRATRYIHFTGGALQSAQIDHLVLSPTGIFVIETKSWSKNFVESGAYHDPFDQVQRASYLCYDTLKQFGKLHVRSIIACAGPLPQKPSDAKIKVLRVEELVGYIASFKEKELKPELFSELKQFLGHHVGSLDRFGGISKFADVLLVRKRERAAPLKGIIFLSIIFFIAGYYVKGVHIGGYFHFEGIFAVALFSFGVFLVVLSIIIYLKSLFRKRLVNKVAVTTGINMDGYSLRKRYDLVRTLISLVRVLFPGLNSRLKRELSIVQGSGEGPLPAQPYKRQAILIPTEPPPLTKEERDRKYMPPAVRADLAAKDKPFSDVNPICPQCKKPMVLRVVHNAGAPGSKFWGCPNYPACRHTIPAEGNI